MAALKRGNHLFQSQASYSNMKSQNCVISNYLFPKITMNNYSVIVSFISELLIILVVSLFVWFFCMHFNSATGGAYFDVSVNWCDPYQRVALICSPVLVRGNTVTRKFINIINVLTDFKNVISGVP